MKLTQEERERMRESASKPWPDGEGASPPMVLTLLDALDAADIALKARTVRSQDDARILAVGWASHIAAIDESSAAVADYLEARLTDLVVDAEERAREAERTERDRAIAGWSRESRALRGTLEECNVARATAAKERDELREALREARIVMNWADFNRLMVRIDALLAKTEAK